MVKKRYKNITIHPAQGGALVGTASDDVPLSDARNFLSASANYTEKLNFRREVDGELRREGWELFNVSGEHNALNTDEPIRGLHQFTGAKGVPIFIAIAGNKIYKLEAGQDRQFAIDFTTDQTGSGLSPNPVSEYATFDGQDAPEDIDYDPDYFDTNGNDFTWKEIYPRDHASPLAHMDARQSDGTYKDPFEGGAYRWEFVEIRNYLIINNGVDLPIVYHSDYGDRAYPLYGLRENGVVSVGTIASYQDRLFCGDLTRITAGQDEWFKNATDPYGPIFAQTDPDPERGVTVERTAEIEALGYTETGGEMPYGSVTKGRFQYQMVYSAEGEPRMFNAGIVSDGYVIASSGGLEGTLTATPEVRDSTTNEVLTPRSYTFRWDSKFAIDTPASMYQSFKFGDHGALDHIGLYFTKDGGAKFDDENFTDVQFDEAVKRLGIKFPTRFNAAATIPDPADPTQSIQDPRMGFLESEILAEQIAGIDTSGLFFKDFDEDWDQYGNKVVTIVDRTEDPVLLLDPTTGNELSGTYEVVLRPFAEQQHEPAQFQEFAQDGTRILKMADLADKLVVYRDSGFFFITKSNSYAQPFAVDPRYSGGRTADFRNTVTLVGGNQHIFMGHTGVYSITRSTTEPKVVQTFELGPPFWKQVPPELTEFVYASDNPVTRELFINCPLGYKENSKGEYVDEFNIPLAEGEQPIIDWGVIAYDYVNQTLSQIDASFTACATVRKPKHSRIGPDQTWFVMGVHQASSKESMYLGSAWRQDPKYGGVIVRYGYGPPEYGKSEPYRLYHRIGYGYTSRLKSGLIDFGNSFSDKETRSYVLELSSRYPQCPVRVKISTTSAPQGTEVIETLDTTEGSIDFVELNNLQDENMIPLFIQAPYIRDEITVPPLHESGSGYYTEQGYMYVDKGTNFDDIIDDAYYVQSSKPIVLANPIKMVGRTFEVSGVDTRHTAQTVGQGT